MHNYIAHTYTIQAQYTLHSTLHTLHSTLYTLHSTLYYCCEKCWYLNQLKLSCLMSSLNSTLDSYLLPILNEVELMTLCCLLELIRPSLKDRVGCVLVAKSLRWPCP